MIDVVIAAAQVKVEHIDGVHLFYISIVLTYLQLLYNCLRGTVEDTLHEMRLASQLYLHNNYLTFAGLCLYVHSVRLVLSRVAITFALQHLHNFHLCAYQHRHQAFEYAEIGLVAQNAFNGPVKADIVTIVCHKCYLFDFFLPTFELCKDTIYF